MPGRGLIDSSGSAGCNPLIDLTYIDNAALAHLLAAERLEPGSPITGRAYFIAQGQPVPLWDMVNRFLEIGSSSAREAEHPPGPRGLPWADCSRPRYTLLRLPGEPQMTRFLARELSTAHWYNLDAARRDLGYSPRVSIEEGLGGSPNRCALAPPKSECPPSAGADRARSPAAARSTGKRLPLDCCRLSAGPLAL